VCYTYMYRICLTMLQTYMRTPYCMTWHDVTCSAFSQPEPGCISCCKACCVTQSAEAHLNGDRYRDIKSFGTFGTMWAWENNTGNGVPDLTAIKKGHAEKLLNFGCQLWMCVVCVCVDMCGYHQSVGPENLAMGHFTHEIVKYGADVIESRWR